MTLCDIGLIPVSSPVTFFISSPKFSLGTLAKVSLQSCLHIKSQGLMCTYLHKRTQTSLHQLLGSFAAERLFYRSRVFKMLPQFIFAPLTKKEVWMVCASKDQTTPVSNMNTYAHMPKQTHTHTFRFNSKPSRGAVMLCSSAKRQCLFQSASQSLKESSKE